MQDISGRKTAASICQGEPRAQARTQAWRNQSPLDINDCKKRGLLWNQGVAVQESC